MPSGFLALASTSDREIFWVKQVADEVLHFFEGRVDLRVVGRLQEVRDPGEFRVGLLGRFEGQQVADQGIDVDDPVDWMIVLEVCLSHHLNQARLHIGAL